MEQDKHTEWHYQWKHYHDDVEFLFFDWISPRTINDFKDMRVLDAGCSSRHHTRIIAPVTKSVTAMDLNTVELARNRLSSFDNAEIVETDIATYQTDNPYDIIYSIGVIHHTDSPENTFDNLLKLCKDDEFPITWCYAEESNAMVRHIKVKQNE